MTDTTDVAAKGLDMIDKWAQQLGSALKQYGPDAVDLAMAVGRVGAIRDVAIGVLFLILAVIWSSGGLWVVKKTMKAEGGFEEASFFMSLIGAVGFLILIGVALNNLLDLYAWAGIFRPEIYLAAKALNL